MDRRAWWATVHEVTKEMDNNNNNLKLPIQQSSLCHQVYACMCVCVSTCDLTVVVQLLSCVQLFATPWTVAYQDTMEFSRQAYWSGLPCPSPGDLPNPGIEPTSLISPTFAGESFTTSTTWEAQKRGVCVLSRFSHV